MPSWTGGTTFPVWLGDEGFFKIAGDSPEPCQTEAKGIQDPVFSGSKGSNFGSLKIFV